MGSKAAPAPGPVERYRARILQAEGPEEFLRELARFEPDPGAVRALAREVRVYPLRIEGVPRRAAALLVRELRAAGGDAALPRPLPGRRGDRVPVVLVATLAQYHRALPRLGRPTLRLGPVVEAAGSALRNFTATAPRRVEGVHRSFEVGGRTAVMGILNVTPDSFSDGGRYAEVGAALERARALEAEGADVIDVGGESTRPGATPVSPDAEWRRVGPVLERLHATARVPVSIDTRHPEVARKALDAGADLVNDVGGLREAAMRRVVARASAAVIVLHMRGEPRTMQSDLGYADLRAEVYGFLARATAAARRDGIPEGKLLVDPGIGFGKSAAQSLELLGHVGELRSLGYPVVVGASRKSFLADAGPATGVGDRLEASLAAAVLAAVRGADVVRVHDVAPTRRALAVADRARGRGR